MISRASTRSGTVYERSASVSGAHPYPLLNAPRLRGPVEGRLAISGLDTVTLMRAELVWSNYAENLQNSL
jgi:hypothetical protein